MFANRYTALVDACALAGALKRNLLLTLAEAEFYRIRWSRPILDETHRAIMRSMTRSTPEDAAERASYVIGRMEASFGEAEVRDFEDQLCACDGLPDSGDAHVVAAAIKTRASVIVTDNIRHFPEEKLRGFDLDVRTPDAFLADTISLAPGQAVAAIAMMRQTFRKPEMDAKALLLTMEARGLVETVDVLRSYEELL